MDDLKIMKSSQSTAFKEHEYTICETCFYGYFWVWECEAPIPNYLSVKQRVEYREKLRNKATKNEYCVHYKRYLKTYD